MEKSKKMQIRQNVDSLLMREIYLHPLTRETSFPSRPLTCACRILRTGRHLRQRQNTH